MRRCFFLVRIIALSNTGSLTCIVARGCQVVLSLDRLSGYDNDMSLLIIVKAAAVHRHDC